MKVELTAASLFTVAILLLTVGVSRIEAASYYEGAVLILVGICLIFTTVYLLEKNIIERSRRQ